MSVLSEGARRFSGAYFALTPAQKNFARYSRIPVSKLLVPSASLCDHPSDAPSPLTLRQTRVGCPQQNGYAESFVGHLRWHFVDSDQA